jgi:pimeloyl-ACP methyl ester carboxylesterase
MGNELAAPSRSKYALSQKNLKRQEAVLLRHGGLEDSEFM